MNRKVRKRILSLLIVLVFVITVTHALAATCPKCGAEVKEGWKFCPACGAKIEKKKAADICPGCAAKVKADWKVCPFCGRPLGEATKLPEGQKTLWNFENAAELGKWKQLDGLTAALSEEHATSGQHSVKIDFPESSEGAPAFRYEKNSVDCRGYKYFETDFYNPGDEPLVVLLKLKSNNHQKQATVRYELPPNAEKTIRLSLENIAKKIDLSDVMYVNFFCWHPKSSGTFYLDNIRLVK